MNTGLKQEGSMRARSWKTRARRILAPANAQRNIFVVALSLSLLAGVYWLLLASDRYVSEARIIIQRTDMSSGQSMDFSSLLGSSTGASADQLLLRDHLLSIDMLQALDAQIGLRAHYSNWRRDPLSRLWSDSTPIEKLQRYFQSRVTVDFDEYTGVLVLRAQAYDPETAHAIASRMVEQGEQHMNLMGHALADEQVKFLERQVQEMSQRAMQARQTLIAFQNENGIASPQSAAQTVENIIGRLETQLTDLQTRRSALLGYLMPGSPSVQEVDIQIAATRKQIEREQKRLASSDGKTLNLVVDEFQRLEMEALFAQDVYKTALVALEKGRIEATRTLKKVSVLQSPSMPEYPLEPRRLYNSVVFLLLSLLVAGVLNLVAVIIRDHRD
jgi:capsular polysaccharide transport system permease protein